MKRRHFLQLGTIGTLSPLWAKSSGLIGLPGQLDSRISVAFWAPEIPMSNPGRALHANDPNPEVDSLRLGPNTAPFQPDLVAAESIQAENDLIGKTVRLSVVGFLPSLTVWEQNASMFHLQLPNAPERNQSSFTIWQYRPGISLPNQAVGLYLNIEEQGVQLFTQFGENEPPMPLTFSFSGEHSLKIRTGVYLVALANRFSDLPNWQTFQMRSSNPENQGARKYPFRLDGDELVQADFPYLALIFSQT